MSVKLKLTIIFVSALLVSAVLMLLIMFALLFVYAIGNSLGEGSGLSDVVLAGRPAFAEVLAGLQSVYKSLRAFAGSFFAPFIVSALLMVAAMAGVFMIFVSRFVMEPLKALGAAARRIADGDLDHVVKYERGDEIGAVCEILEKMRVTLKDSVSDRLQFEDARKLMVAAISHDLRTPITAIRGYAEGILDGVAATDEKKDAYLRTVLSKTAELERMIDDLLIFSRIDMDREIYSFEDVDLAEYMREAIGAIRLDYAGRLIDGMEAEIAFEDAAGGARAVTGATVTDGAGAAAGATATVDAPAIAGASGAPVAAAAAGGALAVSLDGARFRRVLDNLISNAVKYHGAGQAGKIHVLARLSRNRGFAVIEIRDSGVGISEEDLPRVFDVFFMSDRSRSMAAKSYGLGLAIAREIVLAHGGRIWARSKLGAGTSMYVSLPQK
ncbi:MAG: HAMP domain-containing protein [Clostridiales bacterium]|jgi:signal transduction histidine kinase|nr:HAMP domain-containing protein [Clostridiales bacterium]